MKNLRKHPRKTRWENNGISTLLSQISWTCAGYFLDNFREKDFGKLSPLLKSSRLYYIPISLSFFNKKEEYELNERIKFFIKNH